MSRLARSLINTPIPYGFYRYYYYYLPECKPFVFTIELPAVFSKWSFYVHVC